MKNEFTELLFKCICGESFEFHKELLEHKRWLCIYDFDNGA